jgi:signal peptide peptidase SppA
MNLERIAGRAFNRPLLLDPSVGLPLLGYLSNRLNLGSIIDATGKEHSAQKIKSDIGTYETRVRKSYSVSNGIAIIPVDGTLMHKSGYIGSNSGMTGYDGIAAQIDDAIANSSVRGIMFDIDSGGGEVSGVQALSDKIVAAKAIKPIWAHSNEMAASAAYWIASSADKVFLTETSEVGSIGVLTAHRDLSKAMDDAGFKVTLIHAGAHKVDGNPYGALPAEVLADIQQEIDGLRELFAQNVATNRRMSVQDVMDTEARVYRGKSAVDVGLADGVMSFEAAIDSFDSYLSRTSMSGKRGDVKMTEHETTQAQAGVTQEHLNAAVAQAMNAGASAERERISAILGSDAAKGRSETALKLATTTDLSAEACAGILLSVPAASASVGMAAGIEIGAGVQASQDVVQTENKTGIDSRVQAAVNALKNKGAK